MEYLEYLPCEAVKKGLKMPIPEKMIFHVKEGESLRIWLSTAWIKKMKAEMGEFDEIEVIYGKKDVLIKPKRRGNSIPNRRV